MPKKTDDRKIQLDPMEWRDAMKDVAPKAKSAAKTLKTTANAKVATKAKAPGKGRGR